MSRSADDVALDQRHVGAEAGGDRRGLCAGRASADDHEPQGHARRLVGPRVSNRVGTVSEPNSGPAPADGPLLVYVDVTETLRSGWRAGIQRVVCELVRTLPAARSEIELVPICWSKVHGRFRRIDSDEHEALLAPTATQQPSTPPPPRSRPRRAISVALRVTRLSSLVGRARRRRESRSAPRHHTALLLDQLDAGSVFFDVDASWNPSTVARSALLPELRERGVRTAMFLHDLLPQTNPEWFVPQLVAVSNDHVDAHLRAGSWFLCNSDHTAATLEEYRLSNGIGRVESFVVPMGAFSAAAEFDDDDAAALESPEAPYFLVVGTIEPRKNHDLVLDAFAAVHADHGEARLVVVGRPGWNTESTVDRLEAGRPAGVDWRTETTDSELTRLYRGSLAVVVASITEGFGLPVVEALSHGAPVLCSTGGALPEAGGTLVEYFDPMSSDELARLMPRPPRGRVPSPPPTREGEEFPPAGVGRVRPPDRRSASRTGRSVTIRSPQLQAPVPNANVVRRSIVPAPLP